MDITLVGNAENLVKRLVERGAFPTPDSAANSLIAKFASETSFDADPNFRLPDIVFSIDDVTCVPDFPRQSSQLVVVQQSTTLRLPEILDPV